MATSIKLKGDIKKIEAAIKSKATPKSLVPKLEAQLSKIKSELASLSSAKPKKGVTKTKVLSSLQKLKAKIKTTKSLSGYKKSGIDIKKDADVPALPLGKRYSQTTGNPYYEYRLNRADVKQPPKRYPKLEKGGYMADGGETKIDNDYSFKTAKDIWGMWNFKQKRHFLEDHAYDIENGGFTPKGSWKSIAENQSWDELNDVIKTKLTEHIAMGQYAKGGYMADGGETKMEEEEQKVIRGYSDDEAYEYAKGGALEHGLKVGDVIKLVSGDSIAIYNTKDKNSYRVNISEGKREMVSDMDFNKYAQGGRITSAINRDRAYKSNQSWEQDYQRKSKPKNPKYKSSSDFFEGGGEMHRLFEEGEA